MPNPFLIATAALFAATASQAAAEQWDVTNDKSLIIHRLSADELRLTVVCDPEGAFSPPQNYLFVERRGQRVETGVLVVSGDDEAVTLPIVGAAVIPTGNIETWNTAMSILFGGRGVNLTVGDASAQVEVERLVNVCDAR